MSCSAHFTHKLHLVSMLPAAAVRIKITNILHLISRFHFHFSINLHCANFNIHVHFFFLLKNASDSSQQQRRKWETSKGVKDDCGSSSQFKLSSSMALLCIQLCEVCNLLKYNFFISERCLVPSKYSEMWTFINNFLTLLSTVRLKMFREIPRLV